MTRRVFVLLTAMVFIGTSLSFSPDTCRSLECTTEGFRGTVKGIPCKGRLDPA